MFSQLKCPFIKAMLSMSLFALTVPFSGQSWAQSAQPAATPAESTPTKTARQWLFEACGTSLNTAVRLTDLEDPEAIEPRMDDYAYAQRLIAPLECVSENGSGLMSGGFCRDFEHLNEDLCAQKGITRQSGLDCFEFYYVELFEQFSNPSSLYGGQKNTHYTQLEACHFELIDSFTQFGQ